MKYLVIQREQRSFEFLHLMQAWKEEQYRLLEEEQLKSETKGKKEKSGGTKKGQEIIHEESKGSNEKCPEEKFKDEPEKAPGLKEDPSIPEAHSEKVYKVRSHIIALLLESANYVYIESGLQQSYFLLRNYSLEQNKHN